MTTIKFTAGELEYLAQLEEEILALKTAYGCRVTKYSITKLIRKAIDLDEFQAFLLVGGKGHGKSTLSIKSVAYYFMAYEDLPCGEAYWEALSRIAFTGRDLVNKIESYGDIVIWDDAGLHGSTYFWFVEDLRDYIIALNNWYDVARTDVKVVIASTPSKKKLPPTIRNDPEAILVRVRRHGVKNHSVLGKLKESEAIGVRNIEGIYDDRIYRQELFRDVFLVYMPNPVYYWYSLVRKKYSEYARKMFMRALEKAKEKLGYTYTPQDSNENFDD